jgi:hypothetical protein
VTARLNIAVPATLTVLGGNATLSSLQGPAPGVSISGAGAADTISVSIVAGDTAATFGVAAVTGVTVVTHLNTITLTGTQLQVDTALAGLQLIEPVNAGGDVLSLSATDTAALGAQSAFAVNVVPQTGPAFVAPPSQAIFQTNALSNLSGLLLADPIAAGLAAMGLGREETLSLTLSVAQGVLLLPGISALSGIAASGLGTGTIELTCTADEIAALNTLLAGLEFAGPAGTRQLDYALWNSTGVLPRVVTYGDIFIDTTGTPAANGVFGAGTQTLITGGTAFNGTLAVSGTDTVLGDLSGGTIEIAPGGVLELPYDDIALTGSSSDFGGLYGEMLTLSGTLLVGGTLSLANVAILAPNALLEFADGMTVFGTASIPYDAGLELGTGAEVLGNGTLMVGNFSQGGVIEGGTVGVLGGDTLEIDAGWVLSDTLQVAGGAVMVLGPVSPLYGVFDTLPLTIDNSVILSFLGAGAQAITGGYASTLGGTGGAFVIGGPQFFSGTVEGFGIGDALIFPDLESISIFNVGANSFHITGLDVFGATDTFTIFTSIAAGLTPAAGKDAEGDEEVFMRAAAATVTQNVELTATAGVPQPLLGVSIDMTGSNTQSLSLTLTATRGILSGANVSTAASSITLNAANLAALNSELAAVTYTGTGEAGSVVFSSNTGLLAGLAGGVVIAVGGTGTVSGYSGSSPTAAEMVAFTPVAGMPIITQPVAVGGLVVNGAAEFENIITARGFSGTGLLIDGGGDAVFGAAATVSLGADVTIGDVSGAGTLMLLANQFTVGGNVTLAGAAGSTVAVLGTMDVAGTLDIGVSAAAALTVEGSLAAGALSLGNAGMLEVLGTAQGSFGTVTNAGTMMLGGAAVVTASTYLGDGALDLGGTSEFVVSGLAITVGALPVLPISIGAGAVLSAGTFELNAGSIYDAGLITAASTAYAGTLVLAGGTVAAGSAVVIEAPVTGYGVIDAPTIALFGQIEAEGGRLLLAGNVGGGAALEAGSDSVLEITGTLAAAFNFEGTDAELVLDDAAAPGPFSFNAFQMVAGDAVDLVGIAPSRVTIVENQNGAILDSLGNTITMFSLEQIGTNQGNISIVSDGAGGSLLTVDGVLPCFARGTGILSPDGYRKVETLRPNDPVITANGERRPVRWIGWRTLDLGPEAARAARPVLILPNAFGPGRPNRMVRLSPSHCIHMASRTGSVLIPVTHLVNGATILRDTGAQAATYFHIELDRHDIVLADGLACESYFDDGNRAVMYQELGRRCPARRMYAPVVTNGARLAEARRHLHEIALSAGFATRFQPSLRALAGGQIYTPEVTREGEGRAAQFALPQKMRELVLLSTTACPADTNPESEDRRELGVCLGEMRGVQLAAGWQPRAAGDAGTWMGARAMLVLPRAAAQVTLPLAAIMQSWSPKLARSPVDARDRGG